MTERESQIYEWIKEDPMISQQEIADRAGITRSSAAVHISNLMKKGMIRGKGYVLTEENYVTVVGAVNIDISGTPYDSLKSEDSNPGHLEISFGGVGRNVADNLCRLGASVQMITALGDDFYETELEKNFRSIGLEFRHSLKVAGSRTSTYLCVNTAAGDMSVAISDMDIYEKLTPEFMETRIPIINKGQYLVIDDNLPKETIEYLAERSTVPIVAAPVSTTKVMKYADVLDRIYLMKPNRLELGALSGIEVTDDKSAERAGQVLLDRGVQHLVISLGGKGALYMTKGRKRYFPCLPGKLVNTTGCGDAMTGAIVWSLMKGREVEESVPYGLAAAAVCMEVNGAVNTQMSETAIADRMKLTQEVIA
ncbi:MAG: winged helix-turn-helix transcriptional regulator [Lachnospiraceae bacterium]|nr:winged helix-turn-helix transcriptional regulator [Lachnospiraceae bacterium]